MTDSQAMSFGEYIKTLRLQKAIPLSTAARRMSMTPQKLNDIESGRRNNKRISLAIVTTVSKAYGVPLAEIIRNTETAVHTDKTVGELLQELIPGVRLAELLSKQLLDESKEFSPQGETLAIEIHNRIKEMRILVGLMRKRHFNTNSDPVMEDKLDGD